MDNGKARDSYRSKSGVIDLGNEPPLSVDGGLRTDFDRSRVSVRWLSGTILTGLCGAALMGGAVFAALDGEAHFAANPERVESVLRSSIGSRATVRKSDRLPPVTESNGARQVIRITAMTKVGEREVPRVKPFTRVSSNLTLSTSELSANIPRFNPQRALLNMDDDAVAAEERPDAAPDAEVSFVTRDLASVMPRMRIAALVPPEEVLAKVRDAANWPPKFALASTAPGSLAYATQELPADPYAPFEARITAENITMLAKTAAQATGGNPWNERLIPIKKGDTLSAILRDLGATPEEIKAIALVLGTRARDGNLKEGQKLRVLLSPVRGTQRLQPVRVMLVGDSTVEAVAALSDLGRYVSVDVQTAEASAVEAEDDEEEDDGSGVRLYQSIYETALRNRVPRAVVDELIRVYSYDVDFQRKARPGDSLEVLYAGDEENTDAKPDVLFASLTVGGELKKYYRYLSPDDGIVDYYDETGKSAKKFLVRKPVNDGLMRSGFGSRRHPILGYTKMHTGVDWAAPMGTPIYAAGNGAVEKAGWESGYGKYIRLKHNYGYETAYGHMTAFARGIEPGVKVRQGQVIGYVGSTGLSTGAHVHYEILVNNRLVDPMRIKLPRGRVLEGMVLASFERERDKVDNMMSQPTRAAQAGATQRGAAGSPPL
ncbi:MAG TPA: LysM peptidoglycan-binding domain-containing M23 family metallopeptidase [Xanthobacteraceae bacterium]|nr:LysM peptidoglycan-binding domain-containing M23 family metallopeptidase [Xanthobacteraceae bacterium]